MPKSNEKLPIALPMQTRLTPVSTADEAARTVDVVFTTGAAVRRKRWIGWSGESVPFDEILEVTPEAVDLSRLNAGAPVLDSHSMWSTHAQFGVVEKASITKGEGRATLRFPSKGVDEDADRMFAKISEGIIRNVSVGYSIEEVRIEQATDGTIEKRIITRWTPWEISLVTVPADPGAQVRSADNAQTFPVAFTRATPTTEEVDEMTNRSIAPAAGSEPVETRAPETSVVNSPAETEAKPQTRAADLAAERARAAEITNLAVRHAMPTEFAPKHIADGTSLDEVRKIVLDDVAKRAEQQRISPRADVLRDEGDTVRRAMESAIVLRANPQAIRPDNADNKASIELARQYRGMTLLEMGRVFVEEHEGVRLRGLSKRELADVCLGLQKRAGMLSTSDFPNILANVASKRLRQAYEVAPSGWKRISRQSNAPDFKTKAVTQLSNLPTFKEVREGAEFQYAALSDGQEVYALSTYGTIVPITRQTLINDDLGAFDRMPVLLGRAAAEQEAKIFWAIFTNNPNMADGNALFSTQHANLAGAGTAITEVALSSARQAMREQKGFAAKAADAEALNIIPRFLIVSPAKETEAQKMLVAVTATKSGDVNVFQGSLELLVEARLTGNAWYLCADPAQIDTIEYAYLDGEEGLYTETRTGFEIDGIEVKGRVDFAAKAIDWRGLYKNTGA